MISLPLTREEKQELIDDYVENLQKSQARIITDYRGLSVSDITRLRRELREAGCRYMVMKNTLLRRALDQSGVSMPEEYVQGPTAIAFCMDDPVAPAKVLDRFAKGAEALAIRGGSLGASTLDSKAISALAALPPQEVLLAQLLGAVQGPATTLVGLLNAPMRNLVGVLQARSEQQAEAT